MTMTVRKTVDIDGTPVMTIRIVGVDSQLTFIQLLRRAMNTWDQAPAEVKEFADMAEFGYPLQDYVKQAGE